MNVEDPPLNLNSVCQGWIGLLNDGYSEYECWLPEAIAHSQNSLKKMFCNVYQFLRNFHFVNFSHTKTDELFYPSNLYLNKRLLKRQKEKKKSKKKKTTHPAFHLSRGFIHLNPHLQRRPMQLIPSAAKNVVVQFSLSGSLGHTFLFPKLCSALVVSSS